MKRRKYSLKLFVAVLFAVLGLCAYLQGVYAQDNINTVTFDNQSGEYALVKLIGPTGQVVEVPNGVSRTVNVAAGEYYILARYGSEPDKYKYTKGDPFAVEQTATQYSTITITLHKVIDGNYPSHPISSDEFDKALEVNLKDAEAYVNRGNAYYNKGHYDLAISDYNRALELNPRLVEAYINRGNAYGGKGELERAIADFNKALEINPRLAEAYNYRGVAYGKKGEYDRAILDYNKAIEINPRYAEAYNCRGVTYGKKGEYDREILDFNEAIEINPRYAEAYYNLGLAYCGKGEYDRAILDFNEAIEINPRYAEAYYNRIVAYYNKKEYDKVWDDVHSLQGLGYQVHPGLLELLRQVSGRQR